ncbi:MAG: orotidine-5'-phosphate decarboxylase [bacterium]|nr:orotidine-5'-phosphate decarboxylase [bacterium]
MTSADKIIQSMRSKDSLLCVGLDPEPEKVPVFLLNKACKEFSDPNEAMAHALLEFLIPILDAVAPYASAVKPQSAFYERYGHYSIWVLEQVIQRAHVLGLPVILDAKRGDGGPTADAYADAYLGKNPYWDLASQSFMRAEGPLRVEALTIQPYLGDACLMPFMDRAKEFGTCPIVVTKSSFKPNSFVEMLDVSGEESREKLWQAVARRVASFTEGTEGVEGYVHSAVVMGATYPEDTPRMRDILKNALFLVPGYGAQGGGADGAVVGTDPKGLGCMINSSRGILYAYRDGEYKDLEENFSIAAGKAAKAAKDDLNAALVRAGKHPHS